MGIALSGNPNVDLHAESDERPVHEVSVRPFFLSKYEMTQGQWLGITVQNPSRCPPPTEWGQMIRPGDITLAHPVEHVSWEECSEVLWRLGLVLPTEAQWEYAARAGTETPWWTGADPASFYVSDPAGSAVGPCRTKHASSVL